MIDEIVGPAHGEPGRVNRSAKAKARSADSSAAATDSSHAPEVEVSGDLRQLIERVKQAETFRKDRVHEVLEKLQRGELVTSETVREAAERILHEGP